LPTLTQVASGVTFGFRDRGLRRLAGRIQEEPAKTRNLTAHCSVLQLVRRARPRGFEPLTFGSVDRRSIQLSYGR
jgi:hypothetical protein